MNPFLFSAVVGTGFGSVSTYTTDMLAVFLLLVDVCACNTVKESIAKAVKNDISFVFFMYILNLM